ncbi:MAG: hypothetical protein ABIX01_07850 [Chitinophagaceae bacterium]
MKKVALLFLASILLTAIFSYSLKIFLKENFTVLTLKTMLIPCFTWSILLIGAFVKLNTERRLQYFTIAGWVCAIGSAVLVPAGIYNFLVDQPPVWISVVSVIACVIIMSALFYTMLNKAGFPIKWWISYNVLICINMSLFYLSTKL